LAERLFVELGTREVARALGVTPRTIQRRAAAGKLPAQKTARGYRILVPTKTAAKAAGVTQRTIERRAEAGKVRSIRGTAQQARAAVSPKPPAEAIRWASTPGVIGGFAAAERWLDSDAPKWIRDLTRGGVLIPIEAAVAIGAEGWAPIGRGGDASIVPLSDGTGIVTVKTTEGIVQSAHFKLAAIWDLKRALGGLGYEIEVEDTPTGPSR
jgi:excisionase family DNA binding protein